MINPVTTDSPELYKFGQALISNSKGLKKRDRTKAALLQAGCTLLADTSFSSLTVAELCQQAGVAHGTFYLYFADRPKFVAELLLQYVEFLQIAMLQAAKSNAHNPVRNSTATYYRLFEQNPGLMKCLINHMEEFPGAREAFQKLNREWAMTVVVSTERKLKSEGVTVPRDELMRRAYALGGMVDQYLTALFLNNDTTLTEVSADRETTIDTLTLIWTRGMVQ